MSEIDNRLSDTPAARFVHRASAPLFAIQNSLNKIIHLFIIVCVLLTLMLISAEAADYIKSAGSTDANHSAAAMATLVLQPGPADGMDTHIDHDNPDTVFGDYTTHRIGNRDGASYPGGPYRPLLRFDLSVLPSGAHVITASLELYVYNFDYAYNTFLFYRATSAWDENTTWNTQPSYDSSQVWASIFSSTPYRTYLKKEVDVTDLVVAWHEGTYTNYGFYIVGATESDWTRHWFSSSDFEDTSQRPKLVVGYEMRAFTPLVLQGYE